MWVFTKTGFYSVVKKPGCAPDELEVRSRCRKDLQVLKKQTGVKSKILTDVGTDYPFRILMDRGMWANFLANEARSIDYPNFKDEVLFSKAESPRARKHRHDVYFDVWKSLLSLSDTPGKRQWYNWRELEGSLEDNQHLIDDADPDSSPGSPVANAPLRKRPPRFLQSEFLGR